MILAIDTAHDHGSVALHGADGLVETAPLFSPDGFAHVLFGHIEALLARHALAAKDLLGFAAANGPGSFTGLRVALTAVKGLAEATGKPAFGVSNLEALATFGVSATRAPFYDARRGDIYGARPDGVEVVMPFAEFLASLPPAAELIGFDFSNYAASAWARTLAPRSLAGAVGKLAWQRYREGARPDPLTLDANYVRRSDAELKWKEA
jgi:tRNA threonylcarbamoyladenosine biosynthesis protein TsaB